MDVKVLIGVPMGEMGRYNQFHRHLHSVIRPPDTQVCLSIGRSAAENRNLIIDQALAGEFTHILFLDDDMVPEPNIIYKLLQWQVSIVTGLYFTRSFPHQPVIFSRFDDENNIDWYKLEDHNAGLVHVEACGLGACLIETRVFRTVERPWIRFGEIGKLDSWCHDIGFFRRARKVGHLIWCDLNCEVGHIGETVIRPRRINGKWHYGYSTDGILEVTILQPEIQAVQ